MGHDTFGYEYEQYHKRLKEQREGGLRKRALQHLWRRACLVQRAIERRFTAKNHLERASLESRLEP